MKEQQSPRRVRIIGAGMGSLRLLTGEAGTAVKEAQALMDQADVLVDCVFGFSFRGEISGVPARLLGYGGGLSCLKISADLPSGVECDTGRVCAGAFRADVTVTFTGKKPANVSYPAKEFCGETVVRSVGVPEALSEGAETRFFETDRTFPASWLTAPDPQANKGDLGKLLLVCGSWGMAGACVMAAKAALRCGVGLLQIVVEERLYPLLAQAVPQAVYVVLDWEKRREESRRALLDALEQCTACVMGCLYLAGLAAGSLCSRMLSEPLLTYARYFASIDLGLRTTGNAAMVFSVGFLSLFCQLSLVLISGFCVLGIGLIPITMVLKGAGAGIFTALLYQQLGAAKGLVLQALVFWLPETLGSLFVILLSAFALHVSCGLLRCCLGQGGSGLGAASRRLIHRYLTICFVSMLVCGLSVLLTLVFGGLF